MWSRYALLAGALLLGGCAAPPEDLRVSHEPALLPFDQVANVQPMQVQNQSQLLLQARWGGEIAQVRNRAEDSEIEVVQFSLNASGRPLKTDTSGGRFRIRVPGFIDPAIYAPGRLVTALGDFAGRESGKVGEQVYHFPILRTQSVHLWPEIKEPPVRCEPDPFFHSPLLMRPIIVVPRD